MSRSSDDVSQSSFARSLEPAARVVPLRFVRAVIEYQRRKADRRGIIRHEFGVWVDRTAAQELDRHGDLGDSTEVATGPARLLLLAPLTEVAAEPNRQLVRERDLARRIAHLTVDRLIDAQIAAGTIPPSFLHELWEQIDTSAFDEARAVLFAERFLFPDARDEEVWREFAAVFMELHLFVPNHLRVYFPGIVDKLERITAIVTANIGEDPVLDRLRRVADRLVMPDPLQEAEPSLPEADYFEEPAALLAKAQRAVRHGNSVRAALLRQQAGGSGVGDLDKLVQRLRHPLHLQDAEVGAWRHAVRALLVPAARGNWTKDARLLFELQKIATDYERPPQAIDALEWAATFGRRPIRRNIPARRDVLPVLHLRKSLQLLEGAAIRPSAKKELNELVEHALQAADQRMRRKFRPVITTILEEVGLRANNVVENLSREQLVEELLDRISTRGRLTISDLRDALARNEVKLADLSGLREFLTGDPLLLANARLAEELDGVYRRGEIYLRALQRGSSLAFGTPVGRFLTKYLALPFGGAFVILEGMQHLLEIVGKIAILMGGLMTATLPPQKAPREPTPIVRSETADPARQQASTGNVRPDPTFLQDMSQFNDLPFDLDDPDDDWPEASNTSPIPPDKPSEQAQPKRPPTRFLPPQTVEFDADSIWDFLKAYARSFRRVAWETVSGGAGKEREIHIHLVSKWTILGSGSFLLLLFYVPPFRRVVGKVLRAGGRVIVQLVVDFPLWMRKQPIIRPLLDSPITQWCLRTLLLPGLAALFIGFLVHQWRGDWELTLRGSGSAFLVGLLICTSPPWRRLQEQIVETVRFDLWRLLGAWLWGLIEAVLELVRAVMEWADRQLYRIDEWFRFRDGDSRFSLVIKMTIGLAWSIIAYVMRFAINLLIEPQINPIKHFPVVSVSHKLLLPLIPSLAKTFDTTQKTMFVIVGCIPGIFGFLVWELKENWKLYAANRSRRIRRAILGSHGESMSRLLRPGFHSGTIPKVFRHWRHAARAYELYGDTKAAARVLHEREHIVEDLRLFFEREFVRFLKTAPSWAEAQPQLGSITLTTNTVRVEFLLGTAAPLVLRFVDQGGRLVLEVDSTASLSGLSTDQRRVLRNVVLAICGRTGIDFSRENTLHLLGPEAVGFRLRGLDLVVWNRLGEEAVYDLNRSGGIEPIGPSGLVDKLPVISREELILSETALSWLEWVDFWEKDREEGETPESLRPSLVILPV